MFRIRKAVRGRKEFRKPIEKTPLAVKEVRLGRSIVARFGYWLLMRGAKETDPSRNRTGPGKKTKVTRSVLRQNRLPDNLLTIVSADGRKSIVRIDDDTPARPDVADSAVKRIPVPLRNRQAHTTSDRTALASGPLETCRPLQSGHKVIAGGEKKSDHRVKKYEQDLFVKTERNIAAAMKEAQRGISAEQLVIRFGLSVPEASLIDRMCK